MEHTQTQGRQGWLAAGLARAVSVEPGPLDAVALQPGMRLRRRFDGASTPGFMQAVTASSVTFLTDEGRQWCGPRWEQGASWELLEAWLGVVVAPGTWALSGDGAGLACWVWSADERWVCVTRSGMDPARVQLRAGRLVPIVTAAERPEGSIHTIDVAGDELEAVWWWGDHWWVPTRPGAVVPLDAEVLRSWSLVAA